MKIYLAIGCFDWESSTVISAHKSEESAKEAADKHDIMLHPDRPQEGKIHRTYYDECHVEEHTLED